MTDTTSRVIAPTVAALPGSAAERFPSNVAARYRDGDEWKELTYEAVGEAIDELALGLIDLGIEPDVPAKNTERSIAAGVCQPSTTSSNAALPSLTVAIPIVWWGERRRSVGLPGLKI